MPVEGQPGKMQGIRLGEDGEASSINMATLVYKYWEQQGDELYLTVKSIGNGVEIEGIDTLKLKTYNRFISFKFQLRLYITLC